MEKRDIETVFVKFYSKVSKLYDSTRNMVKYFQDEKFKLDDIAFTALHDNKDDVLQIDITLKEWINNTITLAKKYSDEGSYLIMHLNIFYEYEELEIELVQEGGFIGWTALIEQFISNELLRMQIALEQMLNNEKSLEISEIVLEAIICKPLLKRGPKPQNQNADLTNNEIAKLIKSLIEVKAIPNFNQSAASDFFQDVSGISTDVRKCFNETTYPLGKEEKERIIEKLYKTIDFLKSVY